MLLCERLQTHTHTHTHTHSEYVILIAFQGGTGYANAHQCYGIRTVHCLSLLFISALSLSLSNYMTATMSVLLAIDQLNAQVLVFSIKLIIFLYMFRAQCAHHQEVKLYYTASGIVPLCRWPSGAHRTATYRV